MHMDEAWNAVLEHLRHDMPRAAFETWVRETRAVSLDEERLLIAAASDEQREWLESRLVHSVQRLLIGILNRAVAVQFITAESLPPPAPTHEMQEDEELTIEAVGWLDYERIVQPHKQVVVKGYLRRLGMEIGPKAIWLYIGFHQAAWRAQTHGKSHGMPLHSSEVRRFSGLSFGAFWRLLRQAEIQTQLDGLVQRIDAPGERRYRRGRDGRPHRAPVRYRVQMTPRLTRADSIAIHRRLKGLLDQGLSITAALQELLQMNDLVDWRAPLEPTTQESVCHTVMDMARLAAGADCTAQVDHLAQEVQRKIVGALGDIHLTHYFITHGIADHGLTPAQAWLIAVARDMAYLNLHTGERREVVTFQQGYREMAALIGSRRYKTVQAWFHPQWTTQQRGGDLLRFMQEVDCSARDMHEDLRVDSMARSFHVTLDEPLDADGMDRADAGGSGTRTQMNATAGASGSHMRDADGTDLNSLKRNTYNTPKNTASGAAAERWAWKPLLAQNNVHPKLQHELLAGRASVQTLVAWTLYVASPQSGTLRDPLGYALSRLRSDPAHGPGGIFTQLAGLPPLVLRQLIDAEFHALPDELVSAWRNTMGAHNRLLPVVRTILFGKGAQA